MFENVEWSGSGQIQLSRMKLVNGIAIKTTALLKRSTKVLPQKMMHLLNHSLEVFAELCKNFGKANGYKSSNVEKHCTKQAANKADK